MRPVHACAVAVAIALTAAAPAHAQPAMFDYVVKPGDTCDGIALRVYGDAKRLDLLHAANPQLGPLPHHLQPGTVLHLPPDASLAFVRNHVDAFTPGQHPGQVHEALMRGHRVSTYDASGAEVVFASDAVLQLGEDTLVVILGATHGSVTKTASASDTTLINGSLRLHLAELAGRPAAATVSTPAGHHVDVGTGEAQVSVDRQQATRLAVYTGGGKLTAKKQTVAVAAGFGSKAEKDSAPTPPRPLPAAPEWSEPLPAVVFASGTADVAGRFRAGPGAGPAPARWHVQLSRDDRYDDVVVDARVGLEVNRLEARGLPAGKYYARVSAIDADAFEGPATPTAVVFVAPLAVQTAGAGGQTGQLELPPGLYCGLDGAPLASTQAPLSVHRGPAHGLRCAADAQGLRATETTLPAASVGPLRVDASLDVMGPGTGVVHLRVADAAGAPLVGSSLVARANDGAVAGSVEPAGAPGAFTAAVTWREGTPDVALHLVANGVDQADAPALPLPVPPPPPAPRRDFFAIGVLAGGALGTGPFPSQPVAAPALGGELGWLHTYARWSLDVSVRTTWEHSSFSGTPAPPRDDLYTVGVPILLRPSKWGTWLHPYAGVMPELVVDVLHSTYAPVGVGASGLVGLTAPVPRFDRGELFLEVGYRVTDNLLSYGSETRDALFGHLGYRLFL
jgi:phage tail protein X